VIAADSAHNTLWKMYAAGRAEDIDVISVHYEKPALSTAYGLARAYGDEVWDTESWMNYRGDTNALRYALWELAHGARLGDLFVNIGRTGVGKGWGSHMCVYAEAGRAMEPGKTYLVVVRYVFHKGNDLIHLWINPEPGKQPAADDAEVITRGYDTPQAGAFTIGMQPYGLGCYDVDELRVGATYGEVAPTGAKETKDSTGHR
jgi:hypothetical protein